jgi:hypothetical protein
MRLLFVTSRPLVRTSHTLPPSGRIIQTRSSTSMGFRFRQKIRLAPGVDLNLGKSGPSVSVGERGAHITVGERGVTESAGLPGTGLSYVHHNRLPGPLGRLAGAGGRIRQYVWIAIMIGLVAYKLWGRYGLPMNLH